MTLLYTINWKKIKIVGDIITIQITCLDSQGRIVHIKKDYREWIGVCTDSIETVISEIKRFFPGLHIHYKKINGTFKKVLPYFNERLASGNLEYESRSFYKIYTEGCRVEDVGSFFSNRYEIAYYHKSDWSVRIYIDFCLQQHQTTATTPNTTEPRNLKTGFYYKWYQVDMKNPMLTPKSFKMMDDIQQPDWTIAAFDIETIPASHFTNRVPNGMDPGDRIVMISIVKWNSTFYKEMVLYLDPCPKKRFVDTENNLDMNNVQYIKYRSEVNMLQNFHHYIQDCHVLTGYNINNFDIPCIFARLLWLKKTKILAQYSSEKVGDYTVTTFQNKIVLDMYHYFQIFSDYDLSSFKLDVVAKTKLGGDDGKIAIDSVGIHSWYNKSQLITRHMLSPSADPEYCYDILKPPVSIPPQRFGTFTQYLEYCLRDSQLVYRLFCKEMVLGFLIARANFVSFDVIHAMHFGTSRFLLEVFKTYGTVLGYFINVDFFQNKMDGSKYSSVFIKSTRKEDKGKKTYQGALNHCIKKSYFENVVNMDFMSMYPVSMLSSNLCYGTCDILTTQEYAAIDEKYRNQLTTIPYRIHSDRDFTEDVVPADENELFSYPSFDPEKDSFVIVVNQHTKGFLPSIVDHFLALRKYHQGQWKATRNVIHYNSQLCIKLLLNSMYGTMAAKDSPLAYIVLAMAITNLARYQLLGSYHYVKRRGYTICYADTDSLMVHQWNTDDCESVNRYLENLPYVNIKFEFRMERLLILSKKRYLYNLLGSQKVVVKGFQKKVNELVQYMSKKFIEGVMTLRGGRGDPSDGWILWVNTLLQAQYMSCRDPSKYAITRKTQKRSEYVSKTCAAFKMLQKYPEKEGKLIDYTYSRADIAAKEAPNWIMSVEDCRYVNFEQLFMSQKKIFYTILNIGYWNLQNPHYPCQMVINTMHWKSFVLAELKYFFKTQCQNKIVLLVEKGVKYTFQINDCFEKKEKVVLSSFTTAEQKRKRQPSKNKTELTETSKKQKQNNNN